MSTPQVSFSEEDIQQPVSFGEDEIEQPKSEPLAVSHKPVTFHESDIDMSQVPGAVPGTPSPTAGKVPQPQPTPGLLDTAKQGIQSFAKDVTGAAKEVQPFSLVGEGVRQVGHAVEAAQEKEQRGGGFADIVVPTDLGPGHIGAGAPGAPRSITINPTNAYEKALVPAAQAGTEFVGSMESPQNFAMMGGLSAFPTATATGRALHTAINGYFAGQMGAESVQQAYNAYLEAEKGNVPAAVKEGIGALLNAAFAGESGKGTAEGGRQTVENIGNRVARPSQVTHPAGKVTGIDQATGLPIVDRTQPALPSVPRGTAAVQPQEAITAPESARPEKQPVPLTREPKPAARPAAAAAQPITFSDADIEKAPKTPQGAEIAQGFSRDNLKNAASEGFVDSAWGRIQQGKKLLFSEKPGTIENKLQQAVDAGQVKSRDDVAALVRGGALPTEPETGRPVLQPSDQPKELTKAAEVQAPDFESRLGDVVKGIDGAKVEGVRESKDKERVAEKIDEGKPANTIPDYLAGRIAVDSRAAKDQVLDSIRKEFPVVKEEDEFENGKEPYGFRAHTVQVQMPNGMTAELQVLPREMADVAEKTHGDYEAAREAEAAGNKEEFERRAAAAKAVHDEAMQRFNEREGQEISVEKPEPQKPAENIPENISENISSDLAPVSAESTDAVAKSTDKNSESGNEEPQTSVKKGQSVLLPDGTPAKVDYYNEAMKRGRVTTSDGKKLDTVRGADMTPIATPKVTKTLTDSPLEKKLTERVEKEGPELVAEYLKKNTKNGVPYIGADAARELFPEYNEDKIGTHNDVVAPAGAISDAALDTVLAKKPQPGKDTARVVTGSPASGKTSSVLGDAAKAGHIEVDLEKIFTDATTARKTIQKILDAGRKPEIDLFYVSDPKETVRRMIERAKAIGRPAPVDYMAQSWAQVPKIVDELKQTYGDKLIVNSLENSGETPKITQGSVAPALEATKDWDWQKAARSMYEELDRLREEGQVPDKLYDAAIGDGLIRKSVGLPERVGRESEAGSENKEGVQLETPRYKFGNTQTDIPDNSEAAKALESARSRIPSSELAGDGKDIGGNHVTVRYGIKGDDTEGIREFLRQQAPFEASLGKTEMFPPSEHSDGAAVIQAPIDAPELHRLNAELEKHGDFTEPSFAEYKPHATIAYVKPDVADKYVGMDVTDGKKFRVESISITDRNGNAEEIPLEGKGEQRISSERAATSKTEGGENALQKPSPETVPQRQPEQDGGAGSERGRVQPVEPGDEAAGAQQPGEKGTGEPPEETGGKGVKLYSGAAVADPEVWKELFPNVLEKVGEAVRDKVTPEGLEKGILREKRGELDRKKAQLYESLKDTAKEWAKRPAEDSLAFIKSIETGKIDEIQNPEDKAFAKNLREMFDSRRDLIRNLKPGALRDFIENYFPHIWENPAKASRVFSQILGSKRPFQGPASFLKQRTIPTTEEGIAKGLKPVTYNPVDLALLKLHEMDRFIMAHDSMRAMKETAINPEDKENPQALKLANYAEVGSDRENYFRNIGFQKYDDRVGTVYGRNEQSVPEYFDKRTVESLEQVAENLKTPSTRKLKIGGGVGRMGYYSPLEGVVTKFATPIDVLAHEIGHAIDTKYGLKDQLVKDKLYKQELRNLADLRVEGEDDISDSHKRYIRKGEEKMAAMFQAYVYAPERFLEVAPNTYKFVQGFLRSHPELEPLANLKKSLVPDHRFESVETPGINIRGYYWGPRDAVGAFNRNLSPGIAGRSRAFDLYRGASNTLNAAQLGISAYHLGFTSMDAGISDVALGIQKLSQGKLSGVKDIARGYTPGLSAVTNWVKGNQLLKEYLNPGSYEKMSREADWVAKSGGRAFMDPFYSNESVRAFQTAMKDGRYATAAARAFPAAVEMAAKPIMEWVVPRQKLGVFAKMAENILERSDSEKWEPEKTRAEMQKAWDSVDNRMGQLVYDNLFWNRVAKDLGVASVRSMGWNLGTIREIGGGAKDTAIQAGRALTGQKAEVTTRMAYVIGLMTTAGLWGAIYGALNGHKPEELKDYFFPKDSEGKRVSLPSYMKDIYAWRAHPLQTAGHKVHPAISEAVDMLQNRDFYGTEIRNPDDPYWRQAMDEAEYGLKSFVPFSIRNAMQRAAEGGETGAFDFLRPRNLAKSAQSFVGITPAPGYIQESPALTKAREYMMDNRPPGTRTQEEFERSRAKHAIADMYRTGNVDRDRVQQFVKDGIINQADVRKAIISSKSDPLVTASRSLSIQQLLNVYDQANDAEKKTLKPVIARRAESIQRIPDPQQKRAVMQRYRTIMQGGRSFMQTSAGVM